MQILTLALCAVPAALVVTSLVMLVRNEWVYRQRMAILHNPSKSIGACLDDYDRLPSYGEMMARFWVWNVAAFLANPAA